MWTRPYGKTGHDVTVIGCGGMRFPNPEDIDANAAIVMHAYERGINYFDTAPGYCSDKSEDITGAAIRQMPRDKIYVSTKTFAAEPKEMREAIDKSLKRLGVDCIDFYNMWCLTREGEYEERRAAGAIKAMQKARDEGLIRHIVCSSHMQGEMLREVLKMAPFEGVTLGYCAINFPYRDAAVEAAREMGLGVVTMNPLGGGLIPNNAERFDFIRGPGDRDVVEAALHFNVSNPAVTCALVGFSSIEHVDQAVDAVKDFTPYDAAHIQKLRESIIEGFGDLCTGCGYCVPCPEDIPIPQLMDAYNMKILSQDDKAVLGRLKWHWQVEAAEATRCSVCGKCEDKCTQHLPISDRLEEITEIARAAEESKSSQK